MCKIISLGMCNLVFLSEERINNLKTASEHYK
jgi:hypothetical protein